MKSLKYLEPGDYVSREDLEDMMKSSNQERQTLLDQEKIVLSRIPQLKNNLKLLGLIIDEMEKDGIPYEEAICMRDAATFIKYAIKAGIPVEAAN